MKDTLNCLEMGAVDTLVVWENLDLQRLEVRNDVSGAGPPSRHCCPSSADRVAPFPRLSCRHVLVSTNSHLHQYCEVSGGVCHLLIERRHCLLLLACPHNLDTQQAAVLPTVISPQHS